MPGSHGDPLVGPGELGVGEVDIRVTTRALTREDAEKKMEPVVQEIISRLSGYYLGTVIDLGCGSGLLARELAAADYGVLGIDISEALLNIAKERVPTAHFRQESILKAELPPCAAVAAIGECFNYLFDEDNTEQALYALVRSIHEALDPGGLLLFDVAEPGRVPGSGSQHAHTQGED